MKVFFIRDIANKEFTCVETQPLRSTRSEVSLPFSPVRTASLDPFTTSGKREGIECLIFRWMYIKERMSFTVGLVSLRCLFFKTLNLLSR